MLNLTKRLRLFAAVPLIAATALAHMEVSASAADTVPETVGAGVALAELRFDGVPTTACTGPPTNTAASVFFTLTGSTLGHNDNLLVGSTAAYPVWPWPQVTGDPLDGTPLGCRPGDLAPTLSGPGGVIPGNGLIPLVSCPGAQAMCAGGPGTSNVLADEGTVDGGWRGANFVCGDAATVPNVPLGSFVACTLHGSFVRYGGTMLMFLTGCVNVQTTSHVCSEPAGHSEDVAIALQLAPEPPGSCNLPSNFRCDFVTGPYVITPHGTVTGSGSAVQALLDTLYCPLGTGHANGLYPPDPHCN